MTPSSMPAKDMIIPYFFYIMAASSILGQDGYRGLRRGTRKVTEKQVVRAAQLMIDLQEYYNDGFQAVSYAEGKALFAQGRTAMLIGGSADYTGYKQVNPKVDVGVFGFPSPERQPPRDRHRHGAALYRQREVEPQAGGDDARELALVEGGAAGGGQRTGPPDRRGRRAEPQQSGRSRDGARGCAGHPGLVLAAGDRVRSGPSRAPVGSSRATSPPPSSPRRCRPASSPTRRRKATRWN